MFSLRKIPVFALFLGCFPLFALPEQKVLQPKDWAYEALNTLSLEQRIFLPIDSAITVGRAKLLMDEIDENALSPAGAELYDALSEYLAGRPLVSLGEEGLNGSMGIALQAEGFYKTSDKTTRIHDYYERGPFLEIPFQIAWDPYIAGETVIHAAQHEKAAREQDNYTNVPWDLGSQFDIKFPKVAYLSAGAPLGKTSGVNFVLGMGSDFFGRTQTGSVILSDHLERINYAQLGLYSPKLRYAGEVMQYAVNKYHYMHYLSLRPVKWMNFSVAEGVMVNAPLELRFMNPFAIFHGYESFKTYGDYNNDLGSPIIDTDGDGVDDRIDASGTSRIGSYFGLKFEIHPGRYGRFYGLFAMDQLQLPIEVGNWKDKLTPNAFAFQAGMEGAVPGRGGFWKFGLEGVYTLPYMYVLHHKDWSFYAETDPERDTRNWTGTPFGPDTIAGAVWFGYETLRWQAGFKGMFAAQGERSGLEIFDRPARDYRPDPEDYDEVWPPTGTPVYTYTALLKGSYKPYPWLTVAVQPGYRVMVNYNHESGRTEQGFECALSVRYAP